MMDGMKRTFALISLALAVTVTTPKLAAQTTPPADVTITGESADDDFGWRATPAGDVNGDGIPDLIIGAPSNDAVAGFAGRAYLFYGPLTGNIDAASADAIITGSFANESFGASVASAGDMNGDGVNDLIVGAPRFPLNGTDTGRAYIFYGPIAGSMIATQADAIIFGEDLDDDFGVSVDRAGDVNGDGVDDVIVGADQLFNEGTGKAYVFYGPLAGDIQAADAGAIMVGEVA